MANYKIEQPRVLICLSLTFLCFGGIIVLFILGGIYFSDDHPKVLHYANSMCQVDSRSYKLYECPSRYHAFTCYGPIWNVHHGERRDVFAIVEEKSRYSFPSDALDKAYEYQVSKYQTLNSY
jgi:hypothetical protein